MTYDDFYCYIVKAHRLLSNIIFEDFPIEEYTCEMDLIGAYLMLLSGQDKKVYTILESFIVEYCDAEITKEQTDMLLDYINYGSYRYQ